VFESLIGNQSSCFVTRCHGHEALLTLSKSQKMGYLMELAANLYTAFPHALPLAKASAIKSLTTAASLKPCPYNSWRRKLLVQQPQSRTTILFRNLNTIWNHRLDIENRLQQILNHLILAFLACFLDSLYLILGVLVCVFFCLLVAAGMLFQM
jgi:hypothetical protein